MKESASEDLSNFYELSDENGMLLYCTILQVTMHRNHRN